MGREIRKVAKGWEHPKDDIGNYKPIHEEFYGDALADWQRQNFLWINGQHPDQLSSPDGLKDCPFFAQWHGDPPSVEYYMPVKWTPEEACCFQFYETVSEGTPLSPVFETLQQMEDWMVNDQSYSRKGAQKFCSSGWAPSFIISSRGVESGIEALGHIPERPKDEL